MFWVSLIETMRHQNRICAGRLTCMKTMMTVNRAPGDRTKVEVRRVVSERRWRPSRFRLHKLVDNGHRKQRRERFSPVLLTGVLFLLHHDKIRHISSHFTQCCEFRDLFSSPALTYLLGHMFGWEVLSLPHC